MFRSLNSHLIIGLMIIAAAIVASCRKDDTTVYSNNGFPAHYAPIIENTCASTSCHTTESKFAAAGLSMSSWAELMQGGNNGNAAVIPFSSQNSTFFFAINHYAELGPTLVPLMPYGKPPFSKKRILDFAAWIDSGAPDEFGNIAFEPLTGRELMYVLNAECNLVAVVDVISGLIIRYVDISDGGGGFAEIIETSEDGNHFYVCHNSGEVKKFETATNKKVGQLNLGTGFWRSMVVSPNSDRALLADWSGNSALYGGKIALVDLTTMSLVALYNDPADSVYFPYGITTDANFQTAYVSCQTGNFLYKIDISDEMNPVVNRVKLIDSENYQFFGIGYRPSDIRLSADGSLYSVVCEVSNKVYIFQTADDAVVAEMDLGLNPQKAVFSESLGILAVSVMEDVMTMPEGKGFVRLFDLNTFAFITDIYPGYQPRAMYLASDDKTLYIINRNADLTGGDKPHHYSGCQGNNGYATRIDLESLELDPDYKAELNVNPMAASGKN